MNKYLKALLKKLLVNEVIIKSHYLSHRHIVKERSTMRIHSVFDALAKIKELSSLNQYLEVSSNLIELILAMLYQF